MAKTILGIDIGHDQLKLALVKGTRVQRVATIDMPENLMRENRITSRESMADLLRNAMKQKVTFGDLKNCVRNTLEPFLYQKTNRNPIIIPVILNHKDAMAKRKTAKASA